MAHSVYVCVRQNYPPKIFWQFFAVSEQSLGISKRNYTNISSHPISAHNMQSFQYIISFQSFKVVSITAMPPNDSGVLEKVQTITQQLTPFKLIKQHNTAFAIN